MREEKLITLCGETWEVSIWERYVKNSKRDSAQIHEFLHKYGIGKGQAGKQIVPILISAFEESLAITKRQQQELAIAADMLEAEKAKVERYKTFVHGMKELMASGNHWLSPEHKLEYLMQELDTFNESEGES